MILYQSLLFIATAMNDKINDITSVVDTSTIRIFADNVSLHVKVSTQIDYLKLQDDPFHVHNWSLCLQLYLNLEAINFTNKRMVIHLLQST